MTLKFKNFLKKHNAYEAYLRNSKSKSSNPFTFFDNFHWASSPEGYDYWLHLDDLWDDILI